jgi:hypothetical protein
MSHNTSKSSVQTTRGQVLPGLAEFFSRRYPEYVLFIRFVPVHELHKYDLEEAGYGVFTADGENLALRPSLDSACEWVRTEECEPVLMH